MGDRVVLVLMTVAIALLVAAVVVGAGVFPTAPTGPAHARHDLRNGDAAHARPLRW